MEVIKLFVPHSDIGNNSLLEEAYNALDTVVKDINNNEISEWPPLTRNLIIGKPEDFQINQINPIRQTANKLEEAAERAHGIFIFVEGDISDRIKEWYQEQSKLLSGLDDEECVFIRIFWDIRDQKSNECFHKFEERETLNKDSNFIYTYKSIPKLKDELKQSLKKLALTWSSMISSKKEIPTLGSIKSKKLVVEPEVGNNNDKTGKSVSGGVSYGMGGQENDGTASSAAGKEIGTSGESGNKRAWKRFLNSIIFVIVAGLCIYLFWPRIQNYLRKEQSQEQPQEQHQEPVIEALDTTIVVSLIDGATNADSEINQKKDTSEYVTPSSTNSGLVTEPKLGNTKLPIPTANTIIKPNTFIVKADNSSFGIIVQNGIRKKMPFVVPCQEGESPRWILKIEGDKSREEVFKKVFKNQPDKVKISLVVSINDATGTFMPNDTIINSIGESPSGIDVARTKAIDLSVSKIIEFASHYIK